MSADLQRFKRILHAAASGEPLDRAMAREAFAIMMSGDATPAQMAGFLMALRVRGETVEEITAGAEVLRERMVRVRAPAHAVDTCGTGGDGSGSLNISTAAALVVAGCGVPVAKHGNRGLSSRSGSSDVLSALGVNIDADLALVERAIREAGIGFLMAPRHHGAVRHVAGPRVELGTRTIFNFLGPLANPAGVKRQLVGVFAPTWVEPLAHVLANLGADAAWVVHGHGGLDELSLAGPTRIASWDGRRVETFEVTPEDAGLAPSPLEALRGGDPPTNAAAIERLLAGERGAFRDAVLLSAAATLMIAGKSDDLRHGAALAARSIDQGDARTALDALVRITRSAG